MKAILNNYRQSPRKVRLVANLIKGKPVSLALNLLQAVPKSAASPLEKLLRSAVANAKQTTGIDESKLIVKEVRVDGGTVLKRIIPRARGTAYRIRKRTSRITFVLGEQTKTRNVKVKERDESTKSS